MDGRGDDWTVEGSLHHLSAPVSLRLSAADRIGTLDPQHGKLFQDNTTECHSDLEKNISDGGDIFMKPLQSGVSSYSDLSPPTQLPDLFNLPWESAETLPGDPLAALPSLLDLEDPGNDDNEDMTTGCQESNLQSEPLSYEHHASRPSDTSSSGSQPAQEDQSDNTHNLTAPVLMETNVADELLFAAPTVEENEDTCITQMPAAVATASQVVSNFPMQSAELSKEQTQDRSSPDNNDGQVIETSLLSTSMSCPSTHTLSYTSMKTGQSTPMQSNLLPKPNHCHPVSNYNSLPDKTSQEFSSSEIYTRNVGNVHVEAKSSIKVDSTLDYDLGKFSDLDDCQKSTDLLAGLKGDTGNSQKCGEDLVSCSFSAGEYTSCLETATDHNPLSPGSPNDNHNETAPKELLFETQKVSVNSRQEVELESEVSPKMCDDRIPESAMSVRVHEEDIQNDLGLDEPDTCTWFLQNATSSALAISVEDQPAQEVSENCGNREVVQKSKLISNILDDSVTESADPNDKTNSRAMLNNLEPTGQKGSLIRNSSSFNLNPSIPVEHSEDSNASFSSGESVILISDLELSDDEKQDKPILLNIKNSPDSNSHQLLQKAKSDSLDQDEQGESRAEGSQMMDDESSTKEHHASESQDDSEGYVAKLSEETDSKGAYSNVKTSPRENISEEKIDTTYKENQEICSEHATASVCTDPDVSKLAEGDKDTEDKVGEVLDVSGLSREAIEEEIQTVQDLGERDTEVTEGKEGTKDKVGKVLDVSDLSREAIEEELQTVQDLDERDTELTEGDKGTEDEVGEVLDVRHVSDLSREAIEEEIPTVQNLDERDTEAYEDGGATQGSYEDHTTSVPEDFREEYQTGALLKDCLSDAKDQDDPDTVDVARHGRDHVDLHGTSTRSQGPQAEGTLDQETVMESQEDCEKKNGDQSIKSPAAAVPDNTYMYSNQEAVANQGRVEPIVLSDSDDDSCPVTHSNDRVMDSTLPEDVSRYANNKTCDTNSSEEKTISQNLESGLKEDNCENNCDDDVFIIDDEPEVITLESSDEEEVDEKSITKSNQRTMSLRPRKSPPSDKNSSSVTVRKQPVKTVNWACHLCGERSMSLSTLKVHVRRAHNLIMVHQKEDMKCKLCSFKGNWQKIKEHIIKDHETPLKWYIKNHVQSREITKLPPSASLAKDAADKECDLSAVTKSTSCSKARQLYLIKKVSNIDKHNETSSAKVMTTTGSAAKVMTTTASAAKVMTTTASAAKVMTTTASAAKAMTTTASAAKAMTTTRSAAKVMTTTASAAKVMTTTASAAKVMTTTVSATKVMTITASAAKVMTTTASASVSASLKSTPSSSITVQPGKPLNVLQTGFVRLPFSVHQQVSLVPTSRNSTSTNSFMIIHHNATSAVTRTTTSLAASQNNLLNQSNHGNTQVVFSKSVAPGARQGQQSKLTVSNISSLKGPSTTHLTINPSGVHQRVVQVSATGPQAINRPIIYQRNTGQPVISVLGGPGASGTPVSGHPRILLRSMGSSQVTPNVVSVTGMSQRNVQPRAQTVLRVVSGRSVLGATNEQPFTMSAAKALLNAICNSTNSDGSIGVAQPPKAIVSSGAVPVCTENSRIRVSTTTNVFKPYMPFLSSTSSSIKSTSVTYVPSSQTVQAVANSPQPVTKVTQSFTSLGTTQKARTITTQSLGLVPSSGVMPKITLQHTSDREAMASYLIKVPRQLTDNSESPSASREKEDGEYRSFLVKIPVNQTKSPKKFMVHLPIDKGSTVKHAVCIVQPPKAETGGTGKGAPTVLGKISSSVSSQDSRGIGHSQTGGRKSSIVPTFNESNLPGILPLSIPHPRGNLTKGVECLANLQEAAVDIKLLESQFKDTKVFKAADLIKVDDRVQYECARCKEAYPHLMLLQLHHIDCSTHPPSHKVLPIVHIPTALLAAFFTVSASGYSSICTICKLLVLGSARNVEDQQDFASHLAKHTEPLVAITCLDDTRKLGILQTRMTSQQAKEWVDYIVPPFKMFNKPTSSWDGSLEEFVCTEGPLHRESLKRKNHRSAHPEKHMENKKQKKHKIRDVMYADVAHKEYAHKQKRCESYRSSLKMAEGCEGEWVEPNPKDSGKLWIRNKPRPGGLKESIMKSPTQPKLNMQTIQASASKHSKHNKMGPSKPSQRIMNVKIPGRRSLRGLGLDFGQGLMMLPMKTRMRKKVGKSDAQEIVAKMETKRTDVGDAIPSCSTVICDDEHTSLSCNKNKESAKRQNAVKTHCEDIIVISSSEEEDKNNDDNMKDDEIIETNELTEDEKKLAAGAVKFDAEKMDASLNSDSKWGNYTDNPDIDDESSSEDDNADEPQSGMDDSDGDIDEEGIETNQRDIPLAMMALHYQRLNEEMVKSDQEEIEFDNETANNELSNPNLSENDPMNSSDSQISSEATGSQSAVRREDSSKESTPKNVMETDILGLKLQEERCSTQSKMVPSTLQDDGSRSSANSLSESSNSNCVQFESDGESSKESSLRFGEVQHDETGVHLSGVNPLSQHTVSHSNNSSETRNVSGSEFAGSSDRQENQNSSCREDIDNDSSSKDSILKEITSDSLLSEDLKFENNDLEAPSDNDNIMAEDNSCSEKGFTVSQPPCGENSHDDDILQDDEVWNLEENLSEEDKEEGVMACTKEDSARDESPLEGNILDDTLEESSLVRNILLDSEEEASIVEDKSLEDVAAKDDICGASLSQKDNSRECLPEDTTWEEKGLNDEILKENTTEDSILEMESFEDCISDDSLPEAPGDESSQRDCLPGEERPLDSSQDDTVADDNESRQKDGFFSKQSLDLEQVLDTCHTTEGGAGLVESAPDTEDVYQEDDSAEDFFWNVLAKDGEYEVEEAESDDESDIICLVDASDGESEDSISSTDQLLSECTAIEASSSSTDAGTLKDSSHRLASSECTPQPPSREASPENPSEKQVSKCNSLKRKPSDGDQDGDVEEEGRDLKRSRVGDGHPGVSPLDSWHLMDISGESDEKSDADSVWRRDSSASVFPHEDIGQVCAGGL